MNIKVNPNYIVMSAETIEDAGKLGIVSEQLKNNGYLFSFLTHSVLEIPLIKKDEPKGKLKNKLP